MAAHADFPGPHVGQPQAPSAARIADILRSREPWPQGDGGNPLDLAQRIVTQHKHMVDQGGCNSMVLKGPDTSGLSLGFMGGSLDVKVSQLAERVSMLIAGVQRQANSEKQDIERQLNNFSGRTESRLASLESKVAIFDDQRNSLERDRLRREEEASSAEASRTMREVRALVGGAVTEVQAQWRAHRTELMNGQQEQARQLDELGDHTKRGAARLQEACVTIESLQRGLDVQAENFERSEMELRILLSQRDPPPWYGELESSVARLEHRIDEQRATVEMQLGRFRVDAEGVRLRLEGLREDSLCAVDRRIDQEIDRLLTHRVDPKGQHHADKELSRRFDESEARLAALRVRIDAHDGRFTALGERTEAACQQAFEGARQAACQQREEILQEVDCQLSILRQRMEALNEVCDELTVRQACRKGWQVDVQGFD